MKMIENLLSPVIGMYDSPRLRQEISAYPEASGMHDCLGHSFGNRLRKCEKEFKENEFSECADNN